MPSYLNINHAFAIAENMEHTNHPLASNLHPLFAAILEPITPKSDEAYSEFLDNRYKTIRHLGD